MDTSSKKKSTTDTGMKLMEKSDTSKRKVATASVTKKDNVLHSLEDATTHSFEEEEKGMEREARSKIEEQEKKRELHNKTMNLDLLSCRMNQGISRPWTYSYFQYLPAAQKDTGSEKSDTKTRAIKKK